MLVPERLWSIGKNKHFQLNLIEGAQSSVFSILVKYELKTGLQTHFSKYMFSISYIFVTYLSVLYFVHLKI